MASSFDSSAVGPNLGPLNVVFAYRSRILGGAETLFVRMANELAKRGFRVGVLDFADGYLASNVNNGVYCLTSLGNDRHLSSQTVFIVPLSSVEFLREEFNRSDLNPKILLWSLHPDNVNAWLPRFRHGQKLTLRLNQQFLHPIGFPLLRTLVKEVQKQKGLMFMDGPNLRAVESLLGISLDQPQFCPVPGPGPQELLAQAPETVLKIAWVSRLAIDKVEALLRFIADLEALGHLELPIELSIIGDGDQQAKIAARLETSPLNFQFLGRVANAELPTVLSEHHVFAGMGTTLLEAAACGLPGVVVDPHADPIGQGRPYRMFHDSEALSLGEVIAPGIASPAGAPLESLLRLLCDPKRWQEQSMYSVGRAQKQSIERTVDVLEERIHRTQATKVTLRPIFRAYRIWHFANQVARRVNSRAKELRAVSR